MLVRRYNVELDFLEREMVGGLFADLVVAAEPLCFGLSFFEEKLAFDVCLVYLVFGFDRY